MAGAELLLLNRPGDGMFGASLPHPVGAMANDHYDSARIEPRCIFQNMQQ